MDSHHSSAFPASPDSLLDAAHDPSVFSQHHLHPPSQQQQQQQQHSQHFGAGAHLSSRGGGGAGGGGSGGTPDSPTSDPFPFSDPAVLGKSLRDVMASTSASTSFLTTSNTPGAASGVPPLAPMSTSGMQAHTAGSSFSSSGFLSNPSATPPRSTRSSGGVGSSSVERVSGVASVPNGTALGSSTTSATSAGSGGSTAAGLASAGSGNIGGVGGAVAASGAGVGGGTSAGMMSPSGPGSSARGSGAVGAGMMGMGGGAAAATSAAGLPAHSALLPILNPLPAFASPPSSPNPEGPNVHTGSTSKRRRHRSSGSEDMSDGGWSDGARGGEDEPMPKWSVNDFETCCRVYDSSTNEIPSVPFRVQVDKGFKFSRSSLAYICQKKNHFQATVSMQVPSDVAFVATSAGLVRVSGLSLLLYGIKLETPTNRVQLDQSQQDRTKRLFKPVGINPVPGEVAKITIGRLHFNEPTANNMRKKGKPNPDQRFFALVVTLAARSGESFYPIASHISERIIVRASNPRQFESETPVQRSMWIKGSMPNSTFHVGSVGINVEVPDEALCVHGNIRLSGAIMHPSDARLKTSMAPLDPRQQLANIRRVTLYNYLFTSAWAQQPQPRPVAEAERVPSRFRGSASSSFTPVSTSSTSGLTTTLPPATSASLESLLPSASSARNNVPTLVGEAGVLAQELRDVLPEAVETGGDVVLGDGTRVESLLLVNRDRLYLENIGATQELARLADALVARVGQLEEENRALARRFQSLLSEPAVSPPSTAHTSSSSPLSSDPTPSHTPLSSLSSLFSSPSNPRTPSMFSSSAYHASPLSSLFSTLSLTSTVVPRVAALAEHVVATWLGGRARA